MSLKLDIIPAANATTAGFAAWIASQNDVAEVQAIAYNGSGDLVVIYATPPAKLSSPTPPQDLANTPGY